MLDKTGTLTQNKLKVTAVHAMSGFDESHILGLAALTSSDGGQDPVDTAIRAAADSGGGATDLPKLIKFIPFDLAMKMSEATVTNQAGGTVRAVKGAFTVIAGLAEASPDASATASKLEAQGFRVLAVAVGAPRGDETGWDHCSRRSTQIGLCRVDYGTARVWGTCGDGDR